MRKKLTSIDSAIVKAFTLVELLVVLGLFSFIMTIASGALFSAQSVNVRLQETQAVLDNMNLSMEVMTRDIRYGSDFYATSSLTLVTPSKRRSCDYQMDGCKVIYFKPTGAQNDLDRAVYYIDNGILFKKNIPFGSASSTYQITAGDVSIKSLIFFVKGAESSVPADNEDGVADYDQPLITVTVYGVTKPTKLTATSTKFTLQTSISPRELDK